MATTIKDVAKYAGVGIGTVSRVINGDKAVGAQTKKKVLEAMAVLDYSPNHMASQLRRNETRILALLVPVVNHPFFAKLAYFVEDEADHFGYSTILVSSQKRVEKEVEIISRIKQKKVDGAVFVTHFIHEEKNLKDCPLVSIDRVLGENIPYITSDNYDATKEAIRYLIERGATKVGYLGSKPLVDSEVMERERAYRDIMAEYGMPVRMVNEVALHGDEPALAKAFLEAHPDVDGVFVSGYTLSQVFQDQMIAAGKRIPDEVQIASYDGMFSQWNSKSMTSVEQPIEEMAREVVRLLIRKIHGEEVPTRTVLKTKFVKGATTK